MKPYMVLVPFPDNPKNRTGEMVRQQPGDRYFAVYANSKTQAKSEVQNLTKAKYVEVSEVDLDFQGTPEGDLLAFAQAKDLGTPVFIGTGEPPGLPEKGWSEGHPGIEHLNW